MSSCPSIIIIIILYKTKDTSNAILFPLSYIFLVCFSLDTKEAFQWFQESLVLHDGYSLGVREGWEALDPSLNILCV